MLTKKNELLILYLILILSFLTISLVDGVDVLLNPVGDLKNLGRTIRDVYERGISLKFIQSLRQILCDKLNITTESTRNPGEDITLVQLTSLINRTEKKLFISFNFYYENSPKPKIYIYYLVNHPLIDTVGKSYEDLEFVDLNKSHLKNIHLSQSFAKNIFEFLSSQKYERLFECMRPIGAPVQKLRGIVDPAILIEIGINKENVITSIADPIAESIKNSLLKADS